MASVSLEVVKEQLAMAREHALLGSYNTSKTFYDVVLQHLRSYLSGVCVRVCGRMLGSVFVNFMRRANAVTH